MSGTMGTRHAAPLREQVATAIRTEIIDGALAPGERLYEKDLCDRYTVSRTVVREALRQLESEALVTVKPGHGPMVTVLTPADIEALYEVRQELEGLAAELFARRATPEQARAMLELVANMEQSYLHGTLETRGDSKDAFYGLLLSGAGNPVLSAQLAGIHARIGIFRQISFVDLDRVQISYPEIVAIAEAAARDRDAAAARALAVSHIAHASQLAILEYTKRFSGAGPASDATTGVPAEA